MTEENEKYIPAISQNNPMEPRNFGEATRFAEMAADSELVPKDFKGKSGNILIAIQMGYEIGLKPMQSLQNIAIINGRPTIWGDSMLALVRSSSVCEWIHETFDESTMTAYCQGKRRGDPEPQTANFSEADAKAARLWGKPGPWQQYPKRMLQMRARGFLLRDLFPDVLKGMITSEEAFDMPAQPKNITPPTPPTPKPPQHQQEYYDVNQIGDMLNNVADIDGLASWWEKIKPSFSQLSDSEKQGIIEIKDSLKEKFTEVKDEIDS